MDPPQSGLSLFLGVASDTRKGPVCFTQPQTVRALALAYPPDQCFLSFPLWDAVAHIGREIPRPARHKATHSPHGGAYYEPAACNSRRPVLPHLRLSQFSAAHLWHKPGCQMIPRVVCEDRRPVKTVAHPRLSSRPWFTPPLGGSVQDDALMIHPQVHLRIPCYDFSFL